MSADRLCDLCGESGRELYPAQADEGLWRHLSCDGCGLLYVSPLPEGAVNESLYGGPPQTRPPQTGTDRGARTRRLLIRLRRRFAGTAQPRLLDVGCGGGELLALAGEMGFSAEGIDLSPARAEEARQRAGVPVHVGGLEKAGLEPSFHVVRLNQVIEHVVSPRRLLEAAAACLAPGGEIHLATPNADSYTHRMLGSRWRQLGREGNGHLVLLSPRTIRSYAAEVGLRVARLRTRGSRARSQLGGKRRVIRLGEQLLEPWVRLRDKGSTLEAVLTRQES